MGEAARTGFRTTYSSNDSGVSLLSAAAACRALPNSQDLYNWLWIKQGTMMFVYEPHSAEEMLETLAGYQMVLQKHTVSQPATITHSIMGVTAMGTM